MKPTTIDGAIVALRAQGLTFEAIGERMQMTKQAVHARYQALVDQPPEAAAVAAVERTHRLLSHVLAQLARMQTSDTRYLMTVLERAGLSVEEIADAMGTSAATVSTMRSREKRRDVATDAATQVPAGQPGEL